MSEAGEASGGGPEPDAVLLARAADLFFERGFTAVTTAEVAAAAGISKKTLYRLFPSKEALLLAAVRYELSGLAGRLDAIIAGAGESLVSVMQAFLREISRQIGRIGKVLTADVARVPGLWDQIDRLRQELVLDRLRRLLSRSISEGLVRRDIDRRMIMELHVVVIQHLVTLDQILRLDISPTQMFEAVIKIVYGGILTEAGRRGMGRELGIAGKERT